MKKGEKGEINRKKVREREKDLKRNRESEADT